MHMADALLSPAVGGTLWAVSGSAIALSSARLRRSYDDRRIPLMGVAGAFVFAVQMITFTIPGTGSSGHIGGGLLLAVLLSPPAAFVTIASILTIQALFFADGGLLALGCNIFNLGLLPAFITYPLLYRPIAIRARTSTGTTGAAMAAALIGSQLGALGVVLQTAASGISSLPFPAFAALMLPIHLAIGAVEGLATGAVIAFILKHRPEVLEERGKSPQTASSLRAVSWVLLAAALVIGGVGSWHASEKPDGLEWSISRLTGRSSLENPPRDLHQGVAALQRRTTLLPDYDFSGRQGSHEGGRSRAGTSTAGVVGGLISLVTALGIGVLLTRGRRTPPHPSYREAAPPNKGNHDARERILDE